MPQNEIPGYQVDDATLDLTGADGSGLINVDAVTLGAQQVIGTGPLNIVQLDGTARIPSVEASLVFNIADCTTFDSLNSNVFVHGDGAAGSYTAPSSWIKTDLSQYRSSMWHVTAAPWTPNTDLYYGLTIAGSTNTGAINNSGPIAMNGNDCYFRSILAGIPTTWKKALDDSDNIVTAPYVNDIISESIATSLSDIYSDASYTFGPTAANLSRVYSVSGDFDTGAWRHKMAHTSWEKDVYLEGKYLGSHTDTEITAIVGMADGDVVWDNINNLWKKYIVDFNDWPQFTANGWQTTTRGNKRKFPVNAIVVQESSTLWIFDGITSALWMVVDTTGITINAVDYANGDLVLFTTTGIVVWSLRNDTIGHVTIDIDIAKEPTLLADDCISGTVGALSTAPTDRYGLPINTIVAGSAEGTSVQQHDGSFYYIKGTSTIKRALGVTLNKDILYIQHVYASADSYPAIWVVRDLTKLIADTDIVYSTGVGNTLDLSALYYFGAGTNIGTALGASSATLKSPFVSTDNDSFAYVVEATPNRYPLNIINENPVKFLESTRTTITSQSNTGPMFGKVDLAFGCDNYTGYMVGTNLATSGDIAANWSPYGTNTVEDDAGRVKITYVDNGDGAQVNLDKAGILNVDLEVGKPYTFTAQVNVNVGSVTVQLLLLGGTHESIVTSTTPVEVRIPFTSVDNLLQRIKFDGLGVGESVWISDISVTEAVADHSPHANHLNIITDGNLTRHRLVTNYKLGDAITTFNGFNATNYLRQPYNSNLDYGTDDFWVELIANRDNYDTVSQTLVHRWSNGGWYIQMLADGYPRIVMNDGSGNVIINANANKAVIGSYQHIVVVRTSNNVTFYINGEVSSVSPQTPLNVTTGTSAQVTIGYRATDQQISSVKVGGGAPSYHQIQSMWRSAQSVIAGDNRTLPYEEDVVDLGHNTIDDILTVTQPSGTSQFTSTGNRISHTPSSVGILSSGDNTNGILVHGGSLGAYSATDAVDIEEESNKTQIMYTDTRHAPIVDTMTPLVTNGDFVTNINGWTVVDDSINYWVSPGRLRTLGAGSSMGYAYQVVRVVKEREYILTVQIVGIRGYVKVSDATGTLYKSHTDLRDTTITRQIRATSDIFGIHLIHNIVQASSNDWDNIRLVDADPNGLESYRILDGYKPTRYWLNGVEKRVDPTTNADPTTSIYDWVILYDGYTYWATPTTFPGILDEVKIERVIL